MKLPFKMGALAGPFGVGKTLACLDLIMLMRKAGVSKEELLVVDTHGSVGPYSLVAPYAGEFELRMCLEEETLIEFFDKLLQEKQQRKLLVVDTVELLQTAFISQVWEDKSLSAAYKEKASGFMWGRVKKNLGKMLLKLMVKNEAVVVTIHTRGEWVGGAPTGRIVSKFLEPIKILSQFVAVLERRPNVLLPDAVFMPPMGKTQFPALPPRIQEFGWVKMFKYIGETPAKWGELKKEEQTTEGLELLEKLERLSKGISGGKEEGREEE